MNNEQAREFVKNLYQQVWHPMNIDKIDDFYHKDVIAHLGDETANYEDINNRIKYCKDNYKNIYGQHQEVYAEGNMIAFRLLQGGVEKETGAEHKYDTIAMYRLRDNKVAEVYAVFDEQFDFFVKA